MIDLMDTVRLAVEVSPHLRQALRSYAAATGKDMGEIVEELLSNTATTISIEEFCEYLEGVRKHSTEHDGEERKRGK